MDNESSFYIHRGRLTAKALEHMAQIPFNLGPETSQTIALSECIGFEMKPGGRQGSLITQLMGVSHLNRIQHDQAAGRLVGEALKLVGDIRVEMNALLFFEDVDLAA